MKYIKLFEEHILYDRLPKDFKIIIENNQLLIVDSNYKILSQIKIYQIDDNIFDVSSVSSNTRGMGALIYEFAMMFIYPNGLMPSRDGDVREKSFNIWSKFYSRNDIDKRLLNIYDDNYYISIITGEEYFITKKEKLEFFKENDLDDNEIETLEIFNTVYSLKPNNIFIKNIIDIENLPITIKQKLIKELDDFFFNLYD